MATETKAQDFTLDEKFVVKFLKRKPRFGGALGELVFLRTYSRKKPDGTKESWNEVVKRVVEGSFTLLREWRTSQTLSWDADKMQADAQQMANHMFEMKFLPP